jgi:hypothetical protein
MFDHEADPPCINLEECEHYTIDSRGVTLIGLDLGEEGLAHVITFKGEDGDGNEDQVHIIVPLEGSQSLLQFLQESIKAMTARFN